MDSAGGGRGQPTHAPRPGSQLPRFYPPRTCEIVDVKTMQEEEHGCVLLGTVSYSPAPPSPWHGL